MPWDTAHIYEHAFIFEYQERLRQAGLIAQVTSSISGETFETVIFISVLFRNEQASRVMKAYLAQGAMPSQKTINHALSNIENEERSSITVKNHPKLLSQLEQLVDTPWRLVKNIEPVFVDSQAVSPDKKSVELKLSEKDFIDFEIFISLRDASLEDVAVFNRLSGFIVDAACEQLSIDFQAYFNDDDSLVRLDKKRLCFTSRIELTVKNTVKSTDIETSAQAGINKLLDSTNMKVMKDTLRAWSHDPRSYGVLINYYRYSGLIAGAENIEKLAGADRMRSIISMLEIKASRRVRHNKA